MAGKQDFIADIQEFVDSGSKVLRMLKENMMITFIIYFELSG